MKNFYYFSYYSLYKMFILIYKRKADPYHLAKLFLTLIGGFFVMFSIIIVIIKLRLNDLFDNMFIVWGIVLGSHTLSYVIHNILLKRNDDGENKITEYSKKTYSKWQYIITLLCVIVFPFSPLIYLFFLKIVKELFI